MDIKFINIPAKYHPQIYKTIHSFFQKKKIFSDFYISVEFASKNKIQTLNKKYRRLNQPTDVLSFPIWQNLQSVPKKGKINLGDIIICPEMSNIDKELSFLIKHSLDHLVGKHH